ncbi:hypothetical protein KP509_15G067100 [Ceratopteris richardii]|uniref:cellulase n=1 Tax=Ceratopteris richardii TaxID=49495 RepID=A0A8T2T6M2_CERRI|nr:hypothetical protein KP509_15G067100 [Ceratopteris richardii]
MLTAAAAGVNGTSFNYTDALSKCLMFFEVQRSGKLPPSQRITWRGDSALLDGHEENVDLVGGYYDAGDNVKFGFPMAFTVTMLSWATTEYTDKLETAGEYHNLQEAIRWGTDYLLKATATPYQVWVQVGDAIADHNCWQSPETMRTPRTAYQINASQPGTEVAAETAAALAAASIVFQTVDANYSRYLLQRAALVFRFADEYRASYTGECPFYCSNSGYEDELLWAAIWLFKATGNLYYLRYSRDALKKTFASAEFSWDNKNAGAAVLLVDRFFKGDKTFSVAKIRADYFMCSNLPGSSLTQFHETPGGLLYVRSGPLQYSASAAFLASVYADTLLAANQSFVACDGTVYTPTNLLTFAQSQVDYVLGKNPMNISYLVGYGSRWPTQVHHRGASIPKGYEIPYDNQEIACAMSFTTWYAKNAPNPNEAVGAIVAGPTDLDEFQDIRSNPSETEPSTYNNALFIGALARLQGQ